MMNVKNENAVSPVIGVILMVVITVIIAAILAVFAFGIGAPAKAPQSSLKITAVVTGGNVFTITNTGGDSLILKNEKLFVKKATDGTAVTGLDNILLSSFTTPTTPVYLAPGNSISIAVSSGTAGDIVAVQVLDIPTGQLITDTKVTVQ